MTQAISLTELLTTVKEGLEKSFPKPYWVKAEVLEAKEHSSGHCYLELVEKNPDTHYLDAKISASIWAGTYRMLKPYFESVVNRSLSAGMQIMIKVKIQFHPLYGMNLVISDIEPAFTLGDIQLQKQNVLQRLQQEGLMDMNASLDFPKLPFRVAVISSEQAAGFQDFVRELEGNAYAYRFSVELFPAIMQGTESEVSVLSAIRSAYDKQEKFDVLVIVRGGGAQSDLQSFNAYEIGAYIAQFPLPVLTGIGHDKDSSVADEVAFLSLKTPTAVAGFLIAKVREQEEVLANLDYRLERCVLQFSGREMEKIESLRQRFTSALRHYFNLRESLLEQLSFRIKASDPRELLRKGYVLAEDDDGRKIRSVKQLKKGNRLRVYMHDGSIQSIVEEINEYGNKA